MENKYANVVEGKFLPTRLVVKVFTPDGKHFSRRVVKAPKGYGYSDEDINESLRELSRQVDAFYPDYIYHLEATSNHEYLFVCKGVRESEGGR